MSFKHDIPAVIKHISCYNTYYIKYFPGESMANSDIDSKIKELQKIIDDSDNIVFFGGAGVSTESGIPDFRSTDGLYNQEWKYPPEKIISHSFFYSDTKEFYRFYRAKLLPEGFEPNAAHYKLAEMEKAGKLKAIVTQNIDGLHQKAGSKEVYEIHGSTLRNFCQKCHRFYDDKFIAESVNSPDQIPHCTECGGIVKPDVVLYEEGLDNDLIDKTVKAISEADTLIIGGTSLVVYPAAGFVRYFRGRYLVLLNKSETQMDDAANLVIHEPIGQVLSKIKV